MKLEFLLFLMIAAGAVGTACGASQQSGAVSAGSGGGGSTATGTSGTSTGSGTGTGSTGTSGTSGGSGGGGSGLPTDCAAAATCGNFGDGCIRCAAKTACAAEYQACFDNAPCKAYSLCIEPCGSKDVDCLQLCENQNPSGATEYQALSRCVICGDCAALCEHPPDACN